MPKKKTPLILIVLDGWGLSDKKEGNAISLAKTPFYDGLLKKFPNTSIFAHGKHVGLPDGQIGNSEAGHMNIGAGRLVEQDVVKISKSIDNGTFYKNAAFLEIINHVKKNKSGLHLMGLISNGMSPHSDPGHLFALLELARKKKVSKIYLHLFTDGRDSPRYASLNLVHELEKKLKKNEKIVSIMGRFYAMDRKKDWERTEKSYNMLVLGEGIKTENAKEAITQAYNRGESDEYIKPSIVGDDKGSRISNNDGIIFFNLRSDRARQLAKTFVQSKFHLQNENSFKLKRKLKNIHFVSMTDFGPDLGNIFTAYPSVDLKETLPMVLEGHRQLYLAETEKYAHVTYFFNGGYPGIVDGEDQKMIPSPHVEKYNKTPAMSSEGLTKHILKTIAKNKYEFTMVNFAAPDMVGHTGDLNAGIKCCEAIDRSLKRIVPAYLKKGGAVMVTADHGNIEKMLNPKTKEIYTEHTTNKVPFIFISKNNKVELKRSGALCDMAPTVLDFFEIKKPKLMTGRTLISKK
ncbi:2,3-bisphosphoglycerate-independent phosphoglycerate mutase [Candidatus Parcubacteria bacterium]|nr:MAG: 2,3-bisphosphoglycerate-independent phosphoglycerate mutase [Candidatus Parcubacteria bacterium]